MNAEPWVLLNPDGERKNVSEYPRGLREVVLLASSECDSVMVPVREGTVSFADPSLLFGAFSVVGIAADERVQISSDEELRNYFKVATSPCTISLRIRSQAGEHANDDGRPPISTQDFLAKSELAKSQDTVKVNVGGKLREMHRTTAERIPLLAALLRFPRPAGQQIFVDISPDSFDVLLELARGRSLKYLRHLEPSLKELVHEYAEYVGLDIDTTDRYSFSLCAELPSNKTVINQYAFISHRSKHYTTGTRCQWNTVFGDTQIPQSGVSYWEVEVISIGTTNKSFMLGVVDTSFNNASNCFYGNNGGWGIYHKSDGSDTCLRSGGNEIATITDSFPIGKGTVIGILVDADRGSFMFFLSGVFKLSHPESLKGKSMYPALSVYGDTELGIRSGLATPT